MGVPRIEFEFLVLVGRMREAQRAYFADRSRAKLVEARRLEKLVDAVVAAGQRAARSTGIPENRGRA